MYSLTRLCVKYTRVVVHVLSVDPLPCLHVGRRFSKTLYSCIQVMKIANGVSLSWIFPFLYTFKKRTRINAIKTE